jgi:hypothetical protein
MEKRKRPMTNLERFCTWIYAPDFTARGSLFFIFDWSLYQAKFKLADVFSNAENRLVLKNRHALLLIAS